MQAQSEMDRTVRLLQHLKVESDEKEKEVAEAIQNKALKVSEVQ